MSLMFLHSAKITNIDYHMTSFASSIDFFGDSQSFFLHSVIVFQLFFIYLFSEGFNFGFDLIDKRATEAKRDWQRDKARLLRERG